MRKFNLKGNVVQRMLGIQKDPPGQKEAEADAKTSESAENRPEFSELQGELRLACRTDVGKLRKSNQDSLIIGSGLAGVADGMGGHNGGETASAGLRDGLLREVKGKEPDGKLLTEAVQKVNLELFEQQEKDLSLSGMGTTMTVLWPGEQDMIIGQVGDSRAYLIRGAELKQITNDHSMVADMVRKGVLTEEQAACHPMRNYITRAVGTEQTIDVDLFRIPRMKGDRWLVCSDGLHSQVGRTELLLLSLTDDLEEAADKLMSAALENGGKDNITFVLLQDDRETVIPADSATETEEKLPDTGEAETEAENE